MSNFFYNVRKSIFYPSYIPTIPQKCIRDSPIFFQKKDNILFTVNKKMNEVITKEDYLKMVQSNLQHFVYTYFESNIKDIFSQLKELAENGKVCSLEASFNVPELFDTDQTENKLCDYFNSLGYEVIPDPRKNNSKEVVLTIS